MGSKVPLSAAEHVLGCILVNPELLSAIDGEAHERLTKEVRRLTMDDDTLMLHHFHDRLREMVSNWHPEWQPETSLSAAVDRLRGQRKS